MTLFFVLLMCLSVKNLSIGWKFNLTWEWWENSPSSLDSNQANGLTFFIFQSKYANDIIIHIFGMDFIKPCPRPIRLSTYIDKDENEISYNQRRYRALKNYIWRSSEQRGASSLTIDGVQTSEIRWNIESRGFQRSDLILPHRGKIETLFQICRTLHLQVYLLPRFHLLDSFSSVEI